MLNLIPLSVVKLHADLKVEGVCRKAVCNWINFSFGHYYKMNSEFNSNYSIYFQNTRTGDLGIVSCFKLHVQKYVAI